MNKFSLIAQSLGWTLLHSLWQGAIVFTCLFILTRAIGKGHAKIKYRLAMVSFAGLFIWFINTWLSKWETFYDYAVYTLQNNAISHSTILLSPANTSNGLTISNLLPKITALLEPYFPVMVVAYCLGLCCMLLRFGIGIRQMQYIRTKGLVAIDAEQQALLNKLLSQLQITTAVKFYFSERVNVPMVMGSLKPIILLPLATINNLSIEETEAILVHELAHIKRNDYLMNIFQMVVETLMFFNPFTWLISAIIRREREHCCDDMVIDHTQQPLSYAKALTALESYRANNNSIAMAATGNKNQLFNRIKRIMEMKKNSINYSYLVITVITVIALILSVSKFSPLSAQTRKGKTPKTDTSTTVVKKEKIIIIDDKGNRKEYNSQDELPEHEKQRLKEAMNEEDDNTTGKKIKKVIICDSDVNISTVVANAMANVDWDKIENVINDSIRGNIAMVQQKIMSIDYDEILKSVQQTLENVQTTLSDPKLQKDIKKEIEQARKEIENAKKELENAKKEMMNDRKEIFIEKRRMKKEYDDDRKEMLIEKRKIQKENADDKKEMDKELVAINSRDFEKMLNEMQDDGLINKAEGFNIKKTNNTLYIDGIKQSDEVYKKYKHYLQSRNITIKGNDHKIDVNAENAQIKVRHHY